ncbi:MAG TPA: nitroreductase, partial [Dialister sp.]|nr:nitroreductase [Dialister sp.]
MIEEILKRRSIRHFLQKPIPQADLDEILEAGMWAPSEKNAQPWKFIVIRGAERKAMVKRLKEGIMRNR